MFEDKSISEIGYADALGDLSVSHEEILSKATQDGTIGQKPVMVYQQGPACLFFFANTENILSLVLLHNNNLKAIKNYTSEKGMIAALLNYIVNIKNMQLHITADDPLTADGFKWISKLLKTPNGLRITDMSGRQIDDTTLKAECDASKNTFGSESGSTGIVIKKESKQWADKLKENESRLMPFSYFKHSTILESSKPNATDTRNTTKDKDSIGLSESQFPKESLWNSLDQGMSLEDKMSVFEEFHTNGNLLESNEDNNREYFQSLKSLSDELLKNQKYIVVPLSLIANRVQVLAAPEYGTFVGSKNSQLIFRTLDGGQVKYPSMLIRDMAIYNTFTFSSHKAYNKFRVILNMKFGTQLPDVDDSTRDISESKMFNNTTTKSSRNASSRSITQDKHGTYQLKESKMKDNDEFAIKKSQIPAAQRKAKGGDWKVSRADLDKEASRSKSSAGGLAKEKSKLRGQGVMEEPADKSQIPAVQRKAKAKGGDDWRVSLADLDKEASKSRSTKTGLDREKAGLKAKGMMETDKPSAGMTKKEKSAVVKKARAGKDIGKPGKGFAKVEKAAKKGGARNPKAVAAAAMWKQQAKESFRRNVRMVNESLAYYLMEDEEGKAKTITAASDIVNDFTSWMQRVGQYQTKALIELADDIRADFGLQQSEQFKQAVAPALAAALESLTQQREAISNAVAVLAGEDLPQDMMGVPPEGEAGPETPDMEPMEPATPDEMNEPGDEFGASDAAAGAGITGRELRESAFSRRLAESHSIMAKLAK